MQISPDSPLRTQVVAFDYEVSFFFVNGSFSYALRTTPGARWKLTPYTQDTAGATWDEDMAWVAAFNEWNGRSRAVVRIDGVRETASGRLLLMEIEDYSESCLPMVAFTSHMARSPAA